MPKTFWCLLLSLNCLCCEVSLRQPASISVTQGQTAELDCVIDSDDGLLISWYKQIPGESPQFILSAYPARCTPHQYGTGFSSQRFTFKTKGLRNHKLLIRDVEASDSAIYYCARSDGTKGPAAPAGSSSM
ncbi:KVD40 protein, partial [Polypterus senegalus]